MTRKLRFKFLALAVMLGSLAAVTWLDTPAYASCSPNAYEYCTGQCERTYYNCTIQHGSSLPCQGAYDNCTCDCSRMCFGPSPACPAN